MTQYPWKEHHDDLNEKPIHNKNYIAGNGIGDFFHPRFYFILIKKIQILIAIN